MAMKKKQCNKPKGVPKKGSAAMKKSKPTKSKDSASKKSKGSYKPKGSTLRGTIKDRMKYIDGI